MRPHVRNQRGVPPAMRAVQGGALRLTRSAGRRVEAGVQGGMRVAREMRPAGAPAHRPARRAHPLATRPRGTIARWGIHRRRRRDARGRREGGNRARPRRRIRRPRRPRRQLGCPTGRSQSATRTRRDAHLRLLRRDPKGRRRSIHRRYRHRPGPARRRAVTRQDIVQRAHRVRRRIEPRRRRRLPRGGDGEPRGLPVRGAVLQGPAHHAACDEGPQARG